MLLLSDFQIIKKNSLWSTLNIYLVFFFKYSIEWCSSAMKSKVWTGWYVLQQLKEMSVDDDTIQEFKDQVH